jgi:hypothetical protein
MAARKKRRKKASKKVSKKPIHKKRASIVKVAKSSLSSELGLLHNINKKVTRIDHTVNAGMHLAHKAKKAKRRASLDAAWAARDEAGYE